MQGYLEIPIARVALSGLLILLAIGLSRLQRLSLEKELIVGALRAAVQLTAVGFALLLLLRASNPVWVVLTLCFMLAVASYTSARRVKRGPGLKKLMPAAAVSISLGLLVGLGPVLAWIIPVRPMWKARFVIPLGGILMAVGMNAVSLVLERFFSSVEQRRAEVEQALALGANPMQAVAPHRSEAIRAALIPRLNALVTLGLVQLPGLMTGQILSGTSPLHAVRYQLVLMYQLVAMAAIAASVAAALGVRLAFDDRDRLLSWKRSAGR